MKKARMKKLVNFLPAIEYIKRIAGEDAIRVVRICERKGKHVTDEELSKKMRLKVTEVRTILNRLHYLGIACYQKTKNSKTGWYSYTWEIKSGRIAELLLDEITEKMEKLQNQQDLQTNYCLFSCGSGCNPLPFEVATEYGFKCPECGKNMETVNSKKLLKKTTLEIAELQQGAKELEKRI